MTTAQLRSVARAASNRYLASMFRGLSVGPRMLLVACLGLVVACERPVAPPSTIPSRQPQSCLRVFPVRIRILPEELTTAATPRKLALPSPLIESVMRLGKDYVRYTVTVCGGAPSFVSGVVDSTGADDLDRFLDARIPELGIDLPISGCSTVTIVLGTFMFACEAPQFAHAVRRPEGHGSRVVSNRGAGAACSR